MHIVSTAPSLTVVTFRVADQVVALPADAVKDTLVNARPTRVPGAHAWYDGVLAWRGQLVPVLNVARRLGLEADAGAAVVIGEVDGVLIGLRVATLLEEQPQPMADFEPGTPGVSAGCALGTGVLGDRRTTVLDLAALIAPPAATVSTFPAPIERRVGRRGTKRA